MWCNPSFDPLELLDVGGSQSHQNSRHVFYNNFHGIVLVHDLTNRKSQLNLEKWLAEVFQRFGLFTSIVLWRTAVHQCFPNHAKCVTETRYLTDR